jgi:AsmA protein
LRASKLLINGIELRDVDARFDLQRQKLRLRPLTLTVFGGESVTNLTYDMAPRVPTVRVEQQLTDVDTGRLLAALIDVDELQGRGTVKATLAGRGTSRAAIIASLRGPFSLNVRDGELRGADLWYEIQRAAAVLDRKAPPAAPKAPVTGFRRLEASGSVERATLRNDRFEFATGFLTVRGKGDVNYGEGQVKLALEARLLQAPNTAPGSASLASLVGVDIPVTVTGPLRHPQVQPDMARVLQRESEEAGRRLENKVRRTLGRFFGR